MDLTMLGTGNASATNYYNTCFLLEEGSFRLLVDGGGGNGILRQLSLAGHSWKDIRHMFVTHLHMDHVLGILWMERMILQSKARGLWDGEAFIYSNAGVLSFLEKCARDLLPQSEWSLIGKCLHLVEVRPGQKVSIEGRSIEFFDIHSTKTLQYGFTMPLEGGGRLCCCGDEPCNPLCEESVRGSRYLLHEAFCLESEAEIFQPYEKHHSTVGDACRYAQRLGVENLILYHTEDSNPSTRRKRYLEEGRKYFSGNLMIPEDLERIVLA